MNDKAAEKLQQFYLHFTRHMPRGERREYAEQALQALLSDPDTHIIEYDPDAELPAQNNKCLLWDLYQKGWLEAQQVMRMAGWVKPRGD